MIFTPKIFVSGAAADYEEGIPGAIAVGKALAHRGAVVITGATSGVPYVAAKAAYDAGGMVIGFSPASTPKQHEKTYRLPTDSHNLIFYTGYDYAGRDTLTVDLSDAVIEVNGRMGTLHEFTSAFERRKIIGVLLGSGGISDMLPEIVERANRGQGRVIFNADPEVLVAEVLAALEELYEVDLPGVE
jgi:hypothetical protein